MRKKQIYKKWWFWTIIIPVIMIMLIVMSFLPIIPCEITYIGMGATEKTIREYISLFEIWDFGKPSNPFTCKKTIIFWR
mgnify:CR=1 FL=1